MNMAFLCTRHSRELNVYCNSFFTPFVRARQVIYIISLVFNNVMGTLTMKPMYWRRNTDWIVRPKDLELLCILIRV